MTTYLVKQDSDEKLKDAFDRLKSKKFIDEKTTLSDFKRIFSGREVKNPIKWIAKNSDLSYFIKLLYSKAKLLEDLNQKHWKVAQKCFVNTEGIPFDMEKVRKLQLPKTTAKLLESIVSELK